MFGARTLGPAPVSKGPSISEVTAPAMGLSRMGLDGTERQF